jgi:DNA invertase Pin-like site-specific DNA recombinase
VKERAVAYIRVSSSSQLDGYGLEAQEQDVGKCAKSHGLVLKAILRDEGVSGSLEAVDRPGLAEALALLEGGEVEVLLVPRLDRLARKLTIQEAALAQVWRHGGRVIACDQGEVAQDDPDDPMRTAMRQMMGVFGQLERAMIVARLRRGRRVKAELGGREVGAAPFGFRAEGGALVKNENEQQVIERMQEMRSSGNSYRQIADALNSDGTPPKRGNRWHPMSVRRVLERETDRLKSSLRL